MKYTCMFLLTNALKGFNDKHKSKSKANAKWILVKISNLNNVWSLQNDILLVCTLILGKKIEFLIEFSVISKEEALSVVDTSCIVRQP